MMKKLIIKTAIITLCVALALCIALFGILSLAAPVLMMDFTASIGLKNLSGDFAYSAYERTNEVSYLARSAEAAYECENYGEASLRFKEFTRHEGFSAYCGERDGENQAGGHAYVVLYADYVYSLAAVSDYRVAKTESEKTAAYTFAVEHTAADFPEYNPVISLCTSAWEEGDKAFLTQIKTSLDHSEKFSEEDEELVNLKKLLEEYINE